MRIGAHVSASGGLESAVERAHRIGAECLQVFVGSPRVWAAPTVNHESALRFRKKAAEVGIHPVFIHTAYLINMASADESLRKRSIGLIANSMAWAAEMGAAGVVTHLGSPGQSTDQEAEDRVIDCLETVLSAGHQVLLLLETAAGSRRVGGSIEQLGRLMRRLSAYPNVRVCIDTAHMFATGYDVSTAEGIEKTLSQLGAEIGIERIALVHINDSMVSLGHGSDRHSNAGQGHIANAGLANILTHPALRHLPFITEAPGFDDQGPDAANISILRRLAAGQAASEASGPPES